MVNITTGAFKATSYDFYAKLRQDEPVYKTMLPDKTPAYLVTRYDDVQALLKDDRFVKDRRKVANAPQVPRLLRPLFEPMLENMLDTDPPQHTRLRALVHKAFTPRRVEEMRERVQTLAQELLDQAERRGSMDLIRDYALVIPTTVIAQMLGVPAEDGHKFNKWSNAIVAATDLNDALFNIPSMLALTRYLRRQFKLRRADPRDDLISALVQVEQEGDQLSEDELTAMVILLLVAGHETTVNLIGSGTLALLENPDQQDLFMRQPNMMRTAIEELLRYYSPVEIASERYATEPLTIAGYSIPKDGLTLAVIGSANRDASQFTNADMLDITRDPNKHLAFGQGIHYCVGAPLARLEGSIALGSLLERFPTLRLAVPRDNVRWRSGLIMRSLESLPVTWDSRRTVAVTQVERTGV